MKMKKYLAAAMTLATVAGLAAATAPVFAAGTATHARGEGFERMQGKGGPGRGGMMKPGVFGTVSAINGKIITITGNQGFGATATSVTYTIDATSATITKANAAGTIASIAIGDSIAVQGTVTGTNVAATSIRDGIMMRGGRGLEDEAKGAPEQPGDESKSPVIGNGQPIVAGSVTVVTGSTITITNKSNATFTIDATNAKFLQGKNTIALSNIAVGDSLVIQGTINGSSVSATTIMDETRPAATSTTSTTTAAPKAAGHGMFAGIGSFFKHLFGF